MPNQVILGYRMILVDQFRIMNPQKTKLNLLTQVLHASPELPIYARVDIFRDNDGNLALAELEIFEPELWFRLHPESSG